MRDERVKDILDNLSSLIVSHAGLLASEQYRPGADADASDERIAEAKRWVAELRAIRERFENLVTGMID